VMNAGDRMHPSGRRKLRTSTGRLQLSGRLTGQTQWETCEIDDAEGFHADNRWARCHWFAARADGPRGRYTAAISPGFYCPNWAPEREYAERQLAALTGQLIAEGWELSDRRGTDWWRLRFRRRVRVNLVNVSAIRAMVAPVAKALADLPPEQWAEGVRALLEVLEAECPPGAGTQSALAEIKAGIERRLESGHW